jgi:hypothetical protein
VGLATESAASVHLFYQQITDPEALALDSFANGRRWSLFYERLHRIYSLARNAGGTTTAWGYCDPLFIDGTQPITNFGQGVPIVSTFQGLVVGEWDRLNARQKLYSWDGIAAAAKLQERDPNTLQVLTTDPFPNVPLQCTAVGSGTDGYYIIGGNMDMVLFETLGYAIVPLVSTLYANGGTLYTQVSAQLDLATGLAIPIEGVYGRALASPNIYQEPEFFGDAFYWKFAQFVNDDESSAANPKGFFWWVSGDRVVGGAANANQYSYVRKIEWNPNGISGTPNRVHKRVTLTSRIEFDETLVNTPTGVQAIAVPVWYDNATDRISMILKSGTDPYDVDSNILYRFATQPGIDSVTAAAWTKLPKTAETIPFVVEVLGTLGEPVAGADVDFTLEDVGTVDERFEGSVVGVGGTYTLVNGAADSGTIVVVEDPDGAATVLSTPGDYTINGPRTQITGAGGKWLPATTYAVAYEHKSNPVTATHGTLLNASAQSDIDGQAIARVRYPDDDDLVGTYDQLSAEAT